MQQPWNYISQLRSYRFRGGQRITGSGNLQLSLSVLPTIIQDMNNSAALVTSYYLNSHPPVNGINQTVQNRLNFAIIGSSLSPSVVNSMKTQLQALTPLQMYFSAHSQSANTIEGSALQGLSSMVSSVSANTLDGSALQGLSSMVSSVNLSSTLRPLSDAISALNQKISSVDPSSPQHTLLAYQKTVLTHFFNQMTQLNQNIELIKSHNQSADNLHINTLGEVNRSASSSSLQSAMNGVKAFLTTYPNLLPNSSGLGDLSYMDRHQSGIDLSNSRVLSSFSSPSILPNPGSSSSSVSSILPHSSSSSSSVSSVPPHSDLSSPPGSQVSFPGTGNL